MVADDRIVRASTRETIELHILAFAYGLYLIARRFLKWIWDPKKFFMLQQRDQPPPCLVDNSLGTHSYVKIKVSGGCPASGSCLANGANFIQDTEDTYAFETVDNTGDNRFKKRKESLAPLLLRDSEIISLRVKRAGKNIRSFETAKTNGFLLKKYSTKCSEKYNNTVIILLCSLIVHHSSFETLFCSCAELSRPRLSLMTMCLYVCTSKGREIGSDIEFSQM